MTIDMTHFGGHKKAGRDYSAALRDLLPELIAETPLSKFGIAQATGRSHSTVCRILDKVRSEIHIAAWERGTSGPITPLWKWGKGEDAPHPDPMTQAEKSRRYRAKPEGRAISKRAQKRWKRTAIGKMKTKENRRRAYTRKKIKEGGIDAVLKGDPIMFALFGGGRSHSVAEIE